jgi:hypothetical protein
MTTLPSADDTFDIEELPKRLELKTIDRAANRSKIA